MIIATDYPLLDIIWTMLVFFGWVIWFFILITVFRDLFRRHDVSGWGKAAWVVLCVFLPYIGVLAYLIVHGKGMAERNAQDVQTAAEFADYQRSGGNRVSQIADAKQLLDSGAITQEEFDRLKAQALA